MPRGGIQPGPQGLGPAGDGDCSLGCRDLAVPRIPAIGRNRRAGALTDHPAQDIARIHRELQFQQLVEHFFLASAQDSVIADAVSRNAQEFAAEP